MASQALITPRGGRSLVRLAAPEQEELQALVFRRYPDEEWATFAWFGWRNTPERLVLTLASLEAPRPGDLDETVSHVALQEPYSLRVALSAEQRPHAVGVIHSHPEGCAPRASSIDDDMDAYYAEYFSGFAPDRPYVSLILSRIDGELVLSGRLNWRGEWRTVERFAVERTAARTWRNGTRRSRSRASDPRLARLTAAFGVQAGERLRDSTVAVIGAGGTGSAAIEVLARAGVGRLIIVDPDIIETSNLERVHGSRPDHAEERIDKVTVARDHVQSINPACEIRGFVGALPQREVVDAVVTADVALGCTDSHHSRIALSDLSVRYLLPSFDCGVSLEGGGGRVTGQIGQLVRMLPSDPCALCRRLVDPRRMTQELMSPEEQERRRAAAAESREAGRDGDPYWKDLPQLNTVGYLTTTLGAMVAGYAIGWITCRFDPPFRRLQLNLVAPDLDVTNVDIEPSPSCTCRHVRGWADQGAADAMITAPIHWPPAKEI